MKFKKFTDKKLGETVYCGKHPSGLEIRVLSKEGYDSAYAVFGVKYGSIDTAVKNSSGEFETIPEGTAHFLEHKLFESEDLNAFERFAKTGASANALHNKRAPSAGIRARTGHLGALGSQRTGSRRDCPD